VIRPGDMVVWRGALSFAVAPEAITWSEHAGRFVPIGSRMCHMVVSVVDGVITWINPEGCHSYDTSRRMSSDPYPVAVLPASGPPEVA
jgi:hypothetical protein